MFPINFQSSMDRGKSRYHPRKLVLFLQLPCHLAQGGLHLLLPLLLQPCGHLFLAYLVVANMPQVLPLFLVHSNMAYFVAPLQKNKIIQARSPFINHHTQSLKLASLRSCLRYSNSLSIYLRSLTMSTSISL